MLLQVSYVSKTHNIFFDYIVHRTIGTFNWTFSLSSTWFVTAISISSKIASKILAVSPSTPKDVTNIIILTLKLHVVQFLLKTKMSRRNTFQKNPKVWFFSLQFCLFEFCYFFYLCRKTDSLDLLITKSCSETKHYHIFNTMWLWPVTLP